MSMLTASSLEGTYTALITPFGADGRPDFQAFSLHVERQIEAGIDGLVPCGTTGEAATMTAEEQASLIAVCVEVAAGRVPVIAGVGSMSTHASVELTQAAASAGADGLLLVTPPYNKPPIAGLVAHFQAVAEASGGRPIVAYNVPGRTAYDASVEDIQAICDAVPGVIGLKEATGSIERATQLGERFGERLSLLSGDDFSLLPFYSVGGRGAISVVSNLLPRTTGSIYRHLRAGEVVQAQRAFAAIRPLTNALFETTNPIPVKSAAALLGWCEDRFRLPLVSLDAEATERLRAALDRCEELA
ncbi:MAG: 4-hydroxy-tetrahydrodipicolinate synthase [Myxococcota bacterium]|nr:4-hydroxy-tetrahydrodipicolinate synthase [Myxococcota bacterium]